MSKIQLPENAARPLRPGEKYEPILKPENQYPEITPYSVIMGVVMAIMGGSPLPFPYSCYREL